MTLHIFNPEHDLALASNLKNFTSPHAGRQLRHDLAWIPALWAEKGEKVRENVKNTQWRANFSLFIFHFSLKSVPLHRKSDNKT